MRELGLGIMVAALLGAAPAAAQPASRTAAPQSSEIEPGLFVVATPRANLVVLVSHDSAFVVGPQYPALISTARALLAERHVTRPSFVLVEPSDSAALYGDGGWGQAGAVVLAHEALRSRIAMDAARRGGGGSATRGTPSAAVPAMGFSEVVQLLVGGSNVHVIRQRPGPTGGDAVVHFENASSVYLGDIYTADGYPALAPEQGGAMNGMIETVTFFTRFPSTVHFVPGRGAVGRTRELLTYRDMLAGVRDRVQALVAAGRSEAEVVAAKPTASFDATWGRGPVTPDRFVAAVYQSLAKR